MKSSLTLALMLSMSMSCGGLDTLPYLVYDQGAVVTEADTFAAAEPEIRRLVTSWEPDGPSLPMSLTASDGTGLLLRSLAVRGVIDGPVAFTELRMRFENPEDRELEGRFEIALPDGAAVSRFAMRIGERWQEAELVETARAREVYERHLHKRVDPALLEVDAGNRFRARVYPIAAESDKELVLAFSHQLESGQPYRLPLAGMPRIGRVDIDILDGDQWRRRALRDWQPESDLEIQPRGTKDVALRSGELVMLRWRPEMPGAADPVEHLTVMVDTSASSIRAGGRHIAAVRELAARLAAAGDPRIRVAAFDQSVQPVYDGKASGYGEEEESALRARGALGASNLEAALAWAGPRGGRVLLITDGIATAGEAAAARLEEVFAKDLDRLDALVLTGVRDRALLRRLVTRVGDRPGAILGGKDAGPWMRRLQTAAAPPRELRVRGADWVFPKSLSGLQPGDGLIAFARVRGRKKTLKVSLSAAGRSPISAALPLRGGTRTLIERQYVAGKLTSLEHERAAAERGSSRERALRDRIIELSRAFRIETPHTSYLLLESDSDYRRFGIDTANRGQILGVDATGIRVVEHGQAVSREQLLGALLGGPERLAETEPRPHTEATARGAAMIHGVIRDAQTGQPLPGVTVVATSPALQGTQSVITDGRGRYQITQLPPGRYQVTLYFSEVTVPVRGVQVEKGRATRLHRDIDTSAAGGELIEITDEAPTVDPTSTSRSAAVTTDSTRNIPVPGRTFEQALGAAAGSREDRGGSFSGTTGLENQYVVDGINITGIRDRSGKPSPPAAGGAESGRRYAAILRRLERGDHRAALAAALRWRRQAPGDLLALIALGEALEATGYPALAARAYGSILDLHPSRAEMRRAAAARLLRLGRRGRSLAIDALEVAHRQRPDHPHGAHLLALALAASQDEARALDVLLAVRDRGDFLGRSSAAARLLEHDVGVIAAAWLRRDPGARDRVRERLADSGIMVPLEPSTWVVLSWESDATDLDLFLDDGDRREQARDWTSGFGPEVVSVDPEEPWRPSIRVRYDAQAMMGHALGQIQVLSHDGAGDLRVETRPFALWREGQRIDLGPAPRLQRERQAITRR